MESDNTPHWGHWEGSRVRFQLWGLCSSSLWLDVLLHPEEQRNPAIGLHLQGLRVLWPGVQFSHLEMSSLSNVMPASREKEETDSGLSLLQHPWSVLCSHWKEQAGHSQIESHGLPYATPHLPCQAWNCLCKFTSYTFWSSEVRRTKSGQDILLWNVLDLLLSGAICNCSYSYTVRLAAASLLLSRLPSGPETDLRELEWVSL